MGSSRLPALVIKLTHTHLAFYHTEHQDAGPLDFQVSFGVILKALSKWKFTGRYFGFNEVFRGGGSSSDGQI